jgi:hypothetical protein
LQQRPAAEDEDPLLHDVASRLRRQLRQTSSQCLDDAVDGGAQRVGQLIGLERDQGWAPRDEVATLDHQRSTAVRIAQPDLEILGGLLRDQQMVFAPEVLV